MRKVFFIGSLLTNIFLLGYILCVYFSCVSRTSTAQQLCKGASQEHSVGIKDRRKEHRIAILTPASHPALVKVERGFEDTLLKKHNLACHFTTYNANGNRTLMRSQIEEIIQKKYDLIFTIGAHATQMAKEITTKKECFTPLVFGAVADPVRLKIVDSEQSSGTHVTGAATSTNYPDQISLLLTIKPELKKVLIVYDPTQSSGLERDKIEVEKLLTDRGIEVKAVEVYKTSEVIQKITSFLSEVDLVMIFKDNTVVAGIDGLVKLCGRYGVTLFTSDLDSVEKGAVLGFGVHEYTFGVDAAEQAYKILGEKQNPAQMPLVMAKDYKLKLNAKKMEEQGVHMNTLQLLLMKSIEVV